MPDYTRRITYPLVSPANNLSVSIGAAHSESAVIPADSVRLVATVDCYVTFGTAPVADNTCMFLPAKVPEHFQFTAGEKVSVIRSSGDGVLCVTWGD
ncbi:MAG: hypothetical protein ABSG26_17145 [Bryobacteraceae bacterium]|jgi:hypothetical protein